MRWLELRVPPRLIAVAVGLGMWAMSFLEPRFDLPQSHHWLTALGGAVAGAAITLTGAATLRAASTTLLPMRPDKTTSLVSTGIFRWTRNPMYLGLVIALVGWAAFLSAAWPLLGVKAKFRCRIASQIEMSHRGAVVTPGAGLSPGGVATATQTPTGGKSCSKAPTMESLWE